MLKKLLYLFLFILFVFLSFGIYLLSNAPAIPDNSNKLIENIKAKALPELVKGKSGIAKNEDISIWYETLSQVDTPKATVLLIMGHSTSALAWPDHLYQPLLDNGYQVVRYDNRGVGESAWIKNWTKNNPYTLEDMAKDGIAVLDHLGIKKAHIAGVSMGGMIAQRMAISHPTRVQSLTSIMSSGFYDDPELGGVPRKFITGFLGLSLKYGLLPSKYKNIKMMMAIHPLLKGNGDYTPHWESVIQRVVYEMEKRKGYNAKVGDQHTAAIQTSGSRYEELGNINVPTLVIHGTDDPLIPFRHAEKYVPMIPNAKPLWLEGMGHDLPEKYTGDMAKEMLLLFKHI